VKVGDLKNLLKNVPDDALVVLEGGDHTFREGFASYEKIVFENYFITKQNVLRYQNLREYYEIERDEEDYNMLEKNDRVVKALVIT
jgi:hypothetical protein